MCDKLVVCTIYGPSGDETSAGELVTEIVHALSLLCAKWIILGDFNLVQDEWPLGALLSSGAAHSMDEPFGPTCGRRIDYGLCSSWVHATAIDHCPGVGDHLAVRYHLDLKTDFLAGFGPRRAHVPRPQNVVAECFGRQWSPESFDHAIQDGNVDSAWTLLSSAAELSLFEDGHSGLSRAHAWKPRKRCLRPKRAPLGVSSKVVLLQTLRRRILQLSKTPDEHRLREKIAHDVNALLVSFPALNEIGYFSVEHELHVVDQVLQQQAAADKESALRCWKDSLEPSFQRQSSWIRRKADKLCALAASPSPHLQHAVHPVQIVAKAENDWLSRWHCPPELLQANHVAALKCFLNHREQLYLGLLLKFVFAARVLKAFVRRWLAKRLALILGRRVTSGGFLTCGGKHLLCSGLQSTNLVPFPVVGWRLEFVYCPRTMVALVH